MRDSEQIDQDARIALMQYYSSYLRYWGTNLLSITVALATLLLTAEWVTRSGFGRFLTLGLIALIIQASYAFSRIPLFGEWLRQIRAQLPIPTLQPYIYRLDEAVQREYRLRSRIHYFHFKSGHFKNWFSITVGLTFIIWPVVLLTLHYIPMTLPILLLQILIIIGLCLVVSAINNDYTQERQQVNS